MLLIFVLSDHVIEKLFQILGEYLKDLRVYLLLFFLEIVV